MGKQTTVAIAIVAAMLDKAYTTKYNNKRRYDSAISSSQSERTIARVRYHSSIVKCHTLENVLAALKENRL